MKLRHRLHQLEQRLPAGCPACRLRRGLVAPVTVREVVDEPSGRHKGTPQPCAVCGDIPEQVIRIVEQVVECRPLGVADCTQERPDHAPFPKPNAKREP
jgi:hypothetical protein